MLAQVRYMIRDRTSVDMNHNAWISNLPLLQWPIYVNMEMDDHLRVCDLLIADSRDWKAQDVTYLFGS